MTKQMTVVVIGSLRVKNGTDAQENPTVSYFFCKQLHLRLFGPSGPGKSYENFSKAAHYLNTTESD